MKGGNNMLPILHPLDKTKVELKRGITRVELYIKLSNDKNAEKLLETLKNALELTEKISK
jgi:hypothetical protein